MPQDIFNNENEFELALIAMLKTRGWEKEVIEYPSESDLVRNWAKILYENNRQVDRLGDYPLTDTEMQQIIDKVNMLHTPLALNGFINGGTTEVRRDNPDDTAHFGQSVTLKIYDKDEIAAGQSRYQIVRQPRFPVASHILPKRRGDLMLLINGMPVFHIELKKSGIPVSQAYHQIEKYSHEGIFSQGIFSLVQVFVAMTPNETKYFANPGPEGTFNKDFYFHWADFNNVPINEWYRIASDLLSIPMAHQLIGYYTVPDTTDNVLKVMRSYQFFAATRICDRVAQHHWEDLNPMGGHIWHTTGSGKTMTSFKSAQLIANANTADKVIFLMDRIELGTQSLLEYRGFADDSETVQDTRNTDALVSKLEDFDDKNKRLIVTSIQKMALVFDKKRGEDGGYDKSRLDKIRQHRLVFIVDECHRSTFGDMFVGIKQQFPRALFFGFTGTPILEDPFDINHSTVQVFGNELHRYTIGDGITDKNVLGFYPTKVLTYTERDLRQAVAFDELHTDDVEAIFADEDMTAIYNRIMFETPMASGRNENNEWVTGIEDMLPRTQFQTPEHRSKVVEDIKQQFPSLSQNRKFHAILATESIPEAIDYYHRLKQEMPGIKVTAIFDPSIDNNGGAAVKEDALIEILTDYKNNFSIEFTIPQWQKFKKDVSLRMSHKKPYQHISRDNQLDIMIVVDQMLTGFDSKWVNTLYYDKVRVRQDLIQAFSRTNRIFGHDKPFGIIRYYRKPNTMEKNIEEAIDRYSGNRPMAVLAASLDRNIASMNECYKDIKAVFEADGIVDFARLPNEAAAKSRFANNWRSLNYYLDAARMQGFTWKRKVYRVVDSSGKAHKARVFFDEKTYLTLAIRYKEMFSGGGGGGTPTTDVPFDIEPHLIQIDTDRIDAEYMNSRFEKFLVALGGEDAENVKEELLRTFARLSADEQKYANIILHDIQSGALNVEEGKQLTDYIVEYQARAKNDQIHRFAIAMGVNENALRELMDLHPTAEAIDRGGKFTALKQTIDKPTAKAFLEQELGETVPLYQVNIKADTILRQFIVNGGFDIDEDFSV